MSGAPSLAHRLAMKDQQDWHENEQDGLIEWSRYRKERKCRKPA